MPVSAPSGGAVSSFLVAWATAPTEADGADPFCTGVGASTGGIDCDLDSWLFVIIKSVPDIVNFPVIAIFFPLDEMK